MRPPLLPGLRAVSPVLLLDPRIAFEVGGDITAGSAVPPKVVIHFENPALHFRVVDDQLAQDFKHLRPKRKSKRLA